jgi:DNA mismatch repair ATPase MutS
VRRHAQVAIMHMACDVSGGAQDDGQGGEAAAACGGMEEVTFLYKLTQGACPKSYGTNVAKLAGLPAAVVARAAKVSQRLGGGEDAVAAAQRLLSIAKGGCSAEGGLAAASALQLQLLAA